MPENTYDCQQLLRAFRGGELTPERSREYWGDDEHEKLTSRYYSGVGISQIALELQRSELAVIQHLMTSKILTTPGRKRKRKRPKPRCLCEGCLKNQDCKYRKEASHAGNLR